MKAFVYILFSEKLNRFYSGITTLEVDQRIQNHINKVYGKFNFTQKADDWILFHFIECQDLPQARKIEIHIKKMKSSTYLRNLAKYPEMSDKLLIKFKS
ncbi:GIY-YIG nuclease family protein [Mongoliibacter ruber]|uniref:Putative endonuclease n=1 Tax=Mongoliibacter ruber TaxID=1750599 RepID=A0A2T0WVP6_9BACT|nr:GIY-YIG nuclease family protein [Mongoliibacter ruber]PRY90766.1 putative endonuclease [Mongoliibacter ruber]